jgi:hypothetical protein
LVPSSQQTPHHVRPHSSEADHSELHDSPFRHPNYWAAFRGSLFRAENDVQHCCILLAFVAPSVSRSVLYYRITALEMNCLTAISPRRMETVDCSGREGQRTDQPRTPGTQVSGSVLHGIVFWPVSPNFMALALNYKSHPIAVKKAKICAPIQEYRPLEPASLPGRY